MRRREADYLVVGAGAAGMAFVDTLVAESDASAVVVASCGWGMSSGSTPTEPFWTAARFPPSATRCTSTAPRTDCSGVLPCLCRIRVRRRALQMSTSALTRAADHLEELLTD